MTVARGVVVPDSVSVWAVVIWSVEDDPVSLLMAVKVGGSFFENRVESGGGAVG